MICQNKKKSIKINFIQIELNMSVMELNSKFFYSNLLSNL